MNKVENNKDQDDGNKEKIDRLTSDLIGIRTGDRKGCATEILGDLEYKDNTSVEAYQFDAFLVKVVTEMCKNTTTFDVLLMAFGLLDGYSYNETSIGVRREKYLIESNHLKMYSREKISYINADKEKKGNLKGNLKENLRKKSEQTGINDLASFLCNKFFTEKEDIDNYLNNLDDYIEKIVDNKNYVSYRAKLQTPFYKRSTGRSERYIEELDPEELEINPISYYIKSIQISKHHDENNEILYKLLCREDDPPNTEWVATWLTNCIYDKFKNTIDRDIKRRKEKTAPSKMPTEHYLFTGFLRCEKCGRRFHRKIRNRGSKYAKPVWSCSSFDSIGKEACDAKQIPEDILIAKTAEILEITDFDRETLTSQIKEIQVPKHYLLIYVFMDGHKKEVTWQHKSRKDSWTEDMKQKAREKSLALAAERRNKCQKK